MKRKLLRKKAIDVYMLATVCRVGWLELPRPELAIKVLDSSADPSTNLSKTADH